MITAEDVLAIVEATNGPLPRDRARAAKPRRWRHQRAPSGRPVWESAPAARPSFSVQPPPPSLKNAERGGHYARGRPCGPVWAVFDVDSPAGSGVNAHRPHVVQGCCPAKLARWEQLVLASNVAASPNQDLSGPGRRWMWVCFIGTPREFVMQALRNGASPIRPICLGHVPERAEAAGLDSILGPATVWVSQAAHSNPSWALAAHRRSNHAAVQASATAR